MFCKVNYTIVTFFILGLCSCQQKKNDSGTQSVESHARVLVGEIPFSWLDEIHYRQNSNNPSDVVQGGEFVHNIFMLDSQKYKPVASQWIGIKSLDQIVGKEGLYYRYSVTAELYDSKTKATQRNTEFEDRYKKHIVEGTLEMEGKAFVPVIHTAHGKVFYVFTTDMSASWSGAEVGRLKFSLLNTLNKNLEQDGGGQFATRPDSK